jgi:biopolymer transport protein ExbD
MARFRKEQSKDHFDLLPFIAILMCVLGSLLLVTISIAALSIGPGVGEGWVPTRDPNKQTKIPVLIEWDGKTATIHQDGKKVQAQWVAANTDKTLWNFIDELAAKSGTHYALFAVRPSGFDNFQTFADLFRNRKIDVGYEPIKQEKPVKLLKEREQK